MGRSRAVCAAHKPGAVVLPVLQSLLFTFHILHTAGDFEVRQKRQGLMCFPQQQEAHGGHVSTQSVVHEVAHIIGGGVVVNVGE